MFLRYFEISIEANKQIDAASRLEKHGRERVWDVLDAGDDDQRIYAWRDRGASAPEACVKSIDLLLLRDVQTCSNYLSQVHREMEKLTEFHTPSRVVVLCMRRCCVRLSGSIGLQLASRL